ncbi:hypothetical protein C8F01DRAFT_945335, partial [Mycena amicta]
ASIPPIRHALDQANRRAGIRFNKLSPHSPIVQRLPDSWRDGNRPEIHPPLPMRLQNNSKQDQRRTTQLEKLARHTSPDDERIQPFLSPPWRRTADAFGGRLKIEGTRGLSKEDAAKEHIRRVQWISILESHLLIYSDGFMMTLHGLRRVGAGVVGYREDEEVFAMSRGLGGHAEVYDGEIAALSMGARKAAALADADNPSSTSISMRTT